MTFLNIFAYLPPALFCLAVYVFTTTRGGRADVATFFLTMGLFIMVFLLILQLPKEPHD